MRRRVLLTLGLVLLGLTALWHFGLGARWTQRIPPGWAWESKFIGISAYADAQTGKLPEKDAVSIYERQIRLVAETAHPRAVQMEDSYVIRDPQTGQKIWEYIYRALADPQTGAHLQAEFRDEVYLFPREVARQTYRLRNNYVEGVPLAFQRAEEIEGLETYLFAYKGRGEYTEAYGGTKDYPGTTVAAGQEIKCADDQFVLQIWVEPVTGEMLKIRENCLTGDYIYDIASGQPQAGVLRWGGETAGDDLIQRAAWIRAERMKYLAAARYLPLSLLLASVLCLGLGGWPRRAQKD